MRVKSKTIHHPELAAHSSGREHSPDVVELFGPQDDLYSSVQRYREDHWRSTVLAYECRPGDFFNAWQWIRHHPCGYRIHPWDDTLPVLHEAHLDAEQGLAAAEFTVVRVNPKTGRIEDDPALNTATRVWFEWGPVLWSADGPSQASHDPRLDGSADTYEQAVIKLAKRIHARYGNGRHKLDQPDPKPSEVTWGEVRKANKKADRKRRKKAAKARAAEAEQRFEIECERGALRRHSQ